MNFDDFVKQELDYKSSIEKEVIRQMAVLVNAIVNRRKQLNLSQQEVADLTGMTQAQVARLETQSSVPRIETVLRVAVALGLVLNITINEEAAASTSIAV